MQLNVIITGVTGMVGEGVMHECLLHSDISQVLVINRRPCGFTHPKLKEIILTDFYSFANIEVDFTAYQACYFCLGVSSVGMSKTDYYRATYDLTMAVATTMAQANPNLVFCYVTGAGTDSSEKGRSHWARVKGKTENSILSLPFKQAYMFRPGFLVPTPGLKNTSKYYRYLSWLTPIITRFFPDFISTLKELGLAMIQVTLKGHPKPILEVKDIKKAAYL